jgi:hypothetical protein
MCSSILDVTNTTISAEPATKHISVEECDMHKLDYFYDKTNDITEFGPQTAYHASAGTFAFYKEYLDTNKFDDNAEIAEELMFTHHFTNPLIQLESLKTILVICHNLNTFDKNKIMRVKTSLTLKDFVENKIDYDFYKKNLYN